MANRILAQRGVLDAFGHVSVRDPARPEQFLISRSRAAELVEPDDIVAMNLDARLMDGYRGTPYLEAPIHAEIYRARPDVMAIVHSHAPSVIPFAASTVALAPVYHMAGFLSKGAPVFDIRTCFGCTDMLVRNGEQGKALAASLGQAAVALMRGHGFVTTGETLAVAVYRAIYTDLNAASQQKAIQLGGTVTYLDEGEGRLADQTNIGVIEKAWSLWKREAERSRLT
ncbi:class II aldolase/adducin family protein [Burkholderia sp. 22PA0099]|uniref:class II aldolase/adducin family protein n=1 Tax=Burkholderia sp. 22PA0099 TaxID=3237372 RepID=UPI0039C477D1